MQRSILNYRLYVMAVFVAGMAFLAVGTADFVGRSAPSVPAGQAALWLAMLSVAVVSPVPLMRRGRVASLTPAFEFAAILVFGPAAACWLGVLSRLVANLLGRWDSKSMLAIGQVACAVGISGLLYTHMHGRVGVAFGSENVQGIALLAAGLAHLLTRHAIGYGANATKFPGLASSRFSAYRQGFSLECVLLPFAVPLAFAHLSGGVLVAGLFAAPLILARHSRTLWEHAKQRHFEAVRILMSAVDAVDPFTRGHSYRISKMCLRVGRELELTDGELEELEYAALLHDIGRTAIERSIYVKSGDLSPEEQSALRTHPSVGSDLVLRIGMLPEAARIVFSHHEQPNGKGYPAGLGAGDIPIGSRIIMVVAAFDAMTSDRPYRRGMSPDKALEELLARAGSQFFSDIVEAVIELYSRGALFEEFELEVLEQYATGDCNSRAIDEHLRQRGIAAGVPAKVREAVAVGAVAAPALLREEGPETPPPGPVLQRMVLTTDGQWTLVSAALSDIGRTRDNNEDACGIFQEEGGGLGALLVVADGMGGAEGGEVASKLAVETLRQAYFDGETPGGVRAALLDAIARANDAVVARASEEERLSGMGTTCVAACIQGLELTVAHIGDSRAYLITGGTIERLTQDHNLAEEFMSIAGVRGPMGGQNILTRSLGQRPEAEVSLSNPIPLGEGNTIVLCSDGLSNLVQPDEILEIASGYSPDMACTKLVELACQRGGPDNITVEVARVERA